ncbi:hypothetical protein ZIOFF_017656 [Zingiber officinale]|uniref:Uncharacterized protein n=1 Tax=Zingiber officinale TaxID=94328 RepID=A0A8J5H5A2_ZINOF|nr:hypothetical protein ZIOFF_017656 [Zingiber officinale]
MIEHLQKELKAKEAAIETLTSRAKVMEQEVSKRDREIDILRQSLRILSDKRRSRSGKNRLRYFPFQQLDSTSVGELYPEFIISKLLQMGGISCDRSGYVTSIELPVLRISDSLGKEIGLLRRLKKLNLAANDLSGFIPSELVNCTLLEHLKLSNNFLSGLIPMTIDDLTEMDVSQNDLEGNISFSPFQQLDTSSVGELYPEFIIPKSLGINCDRSGYVTSIELPVLQISDSLGKEIGLLRRLKKLNLAANDLSGFIPSELGNCTLLEHLKLSNNFLSGLIPMTIDDLTEMDVSQNDLEGNISFSSKTICKLERLIFSGNVFESELLGIG